MNDKKEFAKQMRLNSAYPIFRQVVNALAAIGYGVATICVIGGVVLWIQQLARQNDVAAWMFLLGGFGYGLGAGIMTLLYQGFLVMMADIADSMLDMNQHRNRG
jgi:choline-glycine betaine transporter